MGALASWESPRNPVGRGCARELMTNLVGGGSGGGLGLVGIVGIIKTHSFYCLVGGGVMNCRGGRSSPVGRGVIRFVGVIHFGRSKGSLIWGFLVWKDRWFGFDRQFKGLGGGRRGNIKSYLHLSLVINISPVDANTRNLTTVVRNIL